MAEELEARAAEHLPFEHFRFRVDAFGSPVVIRERERGRGRLDVEIETSVKEWRFGRSAAHTPAIHCTSLPRSRGRGRAGRRRTHQAGQGFDLRA